MRVALIFLHSFLFPIGHGQDNSSDGQSFAAECLAAPVGVSVWDGERHIEYRRGNCGLILAAPHGGRQKSTSIPERSKSDGVLVTDQNTDRLAHAITQSMELRHGCVPHLVICHLQRKYVDANRPLDAACPKDSAAVQVWGNYQAAIETAKQRVEREHQRGLFVELHGHGHPHQRLELGYLLRGRDLQLPNASFNSLAKKCSLREIVERGQLDLNDLIRGRQSLGHFLEMQGVRSVPSPVQTAPGGEAYFNGGWNTLRHGSRDSGTVSSIQIEFHKPGVRDSDQAIKETAKDVGDALNAFMTIHYPSFTNEDSRP